MALKAPQPMTRRYYVRDLIPSGGEIALPTQEAHHALRVMRVQVGDEIELFDGEGNQARATICRIERKECFCQQDPVSDVSREPSVALHFAIALPKPDRARELVERLTELGVHRLTPVIADRTQRPPSVSQIDKLKRAVVEACKQCGRNQIMQIEEARKSSELFRTSNDETMIIAHPDGSPIEAILPIRASAKIAIGPEGGWTESELEAARQAGYTQVGLGSRIYRVETAAIATAAKMITD